MKNTDPQDEARQAAQIADLEAQLAEIVQPSPESDPGARAARRKMIGDYLEKLDADREAEKARRREAAAQAEFRRYEKRYNWTWAYYVWFINRPRDEREAILNNERVKLHRDNRRGRKPAREYVKHSTPEDRAAHRKKKERERYLRRKGKAADEEQAELERHPMWNRF